MKKSTIISLILAPAVALGIAGGAVPLAQAQIYSYNGSTIYGAPACLNLTYYQGLGSTDALTSGQVTQLQQFLNQTGYLSGVSGTFDQGTYGAVVNYQSSHDLQVTGTLTPQTMAAINQQSCNGTGYNYNSGSTYYPASSNQNCSWNGSTYVCSYYINAPSTNYNTGYTGSNYLNNYNYSYYSCGYNNDSWTWNRYQNVCAPYVGSISASYTYSGVTLTIKGNGFSPTGNSVHIGGSTLASNVYSNGQTIVVSVPTSYQYGSYGVSITNASGVTSNTLSFVMGGYPNNYYGNYNYPYNNNDNYQYNDQYNYNDQNASGNVSGPSAVQAGVANNWTVTMSNNYYSGETVSIDWGDGTTSNNSQTVYGSQSLSYTHVYQYQGNYTIRATVTGANGYTSNSTTPVTVTAGNNYYNPSYNYNYSYSY